MISFNKHIFFFFQAQTKNLTRQQHYKAQQRPINQTTHTKAERITSSTCSNHGKRDPRVWRPNPSSSPTCRSSPTQGTTGSAGTKPHDLHGVHHLSHITKLRRASINLCWDLVQAKHRRPITCNGITTGGELTSTVVEISSATLTPEKPKLSTKRKTFRKSIAS